MRLKAAVVVTTPVLLQQSVVALAAQPAMIVATEVGERIATVIATLAQLRATRQVATHRAVAPHQVVLDAAKHTLRCQ